MRTQTLGAPRDLATSIPSLDPEVVRKPAINPSCRPQIDLKGVVNIFFREIAEYVVVESTTPQVIDVFLLVACSDGIGLNGVDHQREYVTSSGLFCKKANFAACGG